MTYSKLLQQMTEVVVVITLIGCTTPATPLEAATPTQIPPVIPSPSPTATLVQISSFAECVEAGYSIQRTYPRQCISDNDEIFEETLDEGIIFSKVYGEKGRSEEAVSITLTDDGGYLITGTEPHVRKFDVSGEKEWEYNLGSELGKEFPFANAAFGCGLARQTSNGGYMIMAVASTMHEDGGQNVIRFFTIKLDRDGKWGSVEAIAEKAGKVFYLDSDGKPVWLTSLGIEIGMQRKVVETLDGGYAMAGPLPQDSSGSN